MADGVDDTAVVPAAAAALASHHLQPPSSPLLHRRHRPACSCTRRPHQTVKFHRWMATSKSSSKIWCVSVCSTTGHLFEPSSAGSATPLAAVDFKLVNGFSSSRWIRALNRIWLVRCCRCKWPNAACCNQNTGGRPSSFSFQCTAECLGLRTLSSGRQWPAACITCARVIYWQWGSPWTAAAFVACLRRPAGRRRIGAAYVMDAAVQAQL
jgi:hypothetical protein